MFKIVFVACGLSIIGWVFGHGTVYNPVARQTRWRFDPSAPADYNDVGLYCGGYSVS